MSSTSEAPDWPRVSMLWALTVSLLIAAAMVASIVLSVHSLRGGALPGCAPGTTYDCDSVLASRWSKWLGIPVSLPAVGMYLGTIALLVVIGPGGTPATRRVAWRLLPILAGAILGAAAWFIVLQLTVTEAICPWCMAAHATGALAALAILVRTPWRCRPAVGVMPTVTAVALLLAVLIVPQLVVRPRELQVVKMLPAAATDQADTGVERRVMLLGGRLGFDPHAYPLLGNPDASHMLGYLFDYTCPHCRTLHSVLKQVLQRYGDDQVAIAIIPVPLDAGCNPDVEETEPRHQNACVYARLALAVWKADRTKFAAINAWLFEGNKPAGVSDAQAYAESLIGSDRLAGILAAGWPDEQIARNIKAYHLSGGGAVPKLLGAQTLIAGRPGEPAELFNVLEREMGLIPRP